MTFSQKTDKNQMLGARLIYLAGEVPDGQVENVDNRETTEEEKRDLLDLLADPKLIGVQASARENLKKFSTGSLSERLLNGEKKVQDIFNKCKTDINRLDRAVMAVHEFLGGKELATTANRMKQLANQCWVDTQLTQTISQGRISSIGYTADHGQPLNSGDVIYTIGDDKEARDFKVSGYDVFVEISNRPGQFAGVIGNPPFPDVSHPDYKPKAPETPAKPKEGSDLNA